MNNSHVCLKCVPNQHTLHAILSELDIWLDSLCSNPAEASLCVHVLPEECFEVVWQLRAACIARVHGDIH